MSCVWYTKHHTYIYICNTINPILYFLSLQTGFGLEINESNSSEVFNGLTALAAWVSMLGTTYVGIIYDKKRKKKKRMKKEGEILH